MCSRLYNQRLRSIVMVRVLKSAVGTLHPQIGASAAPFKPDGSGHAVKRTAGITTVWNTNLAFQTTALRSSG
ncbi:hypothetical protein HDC90_004204 [Pedobacter sp. AK013]|nr:hypothetical protein [Pedobacter sp. AK013]